MDLCDIHPSIHLFIYSLTINEMKWKQDRLENEKWMIIIIWQWKISDKFSSSSSVILDKKFQPPIEIKVLLFFHFISFLLLFSVSIFFIRYLDYHHHHHRQFPMLNNNNTQDSKNSSSSSSSFNDHRLDWFSIWRSMINLWK